MFFCHIITKKIKLTENWEPVWRNKTSKGSCQEQEYEKDNIQLGRTTSEVDKAITRRSNEGNGDHS